MREFKFRAFDTRAKKWLCGYEKLGGFSLMGECIIFGEWGNQLGPIDQWNDIIVMQFTGLKDKNGKDIYEGDILASEGRVIGHVQGGVRGYCYDVVYLNPKHDKRCSLYYVVTVDYRNTIEVIGDIYSNSEILK